MAPRSTESRRVVTASHGKKRAAVACPHCGIGTLLVIQRKRLSCPTCAYRKPLPTDIKLHRLGAIPLPLTL